jgi:hypothetical protein
MKYTETKKLASLHGIYFNKFEILPGNESALASIRPFN